MFSFRKLFLLNLIFNTICVTSVLGIVNGYSDDIENNPWQVSLNMPGSIWFTDDHICGGVIIEKNGY